MRVGNGGAARNAPKRKARSVRLHVRTLATSKTQYDLSRIVSMFHFVNYLYEFC